MPTYTFREVSVRAVRRGICPVCGNKCQVRKNFFQTLNPFNKNKDGSLKSAKDIYAELAPQVAEWERGQAVHVKCAGLQS